MMKMNPDQWLLPSRRPVPATPRVAVVGGDGIGPEVVEAAVEVLLSAGAKLELVRPLHGRAAKVAEGTALPVATQSVLREADAILFGAVEEESKPVLRFIRFELVTYANIRPAVSLPGVPSITGDGRTNLIVVRELTEGMYPGREGDLQEWHQHWPEFKDSMAKILPKQGAFAVRVITPEASARIARYAAELAKHRQQKGYARGHVTIVHKRNVLPKTDGVFHAACLRSIEAVGGLSWDELYIDEAARRMVVHPEKFDVVVTTNLFGDVLSDVAAEAMGGMPMAPSAGLGDSACYFEPCHGSAPDIVGQNVANPAATILSGAMMLTYLGQSAVAERVLDAVCRTIAEGERTRDLGGNLSTSAFTQAVKNRLAR